MTRPCLRHLFLISITLSLILPSFALDALATSPSPDFNATSPASQLSPRENVQSPVFPAVDTPKLNVLEVIKGMGSAIQLLISQQKNQGGSRSDLQPAPSVTVVSAESKEKYREQAEKLRSDINRRAGQLQKVVGAASEAMKDRGDVMVRRILINLNSRLGQAKARADKILSEPESSELAVRTLNTINQGLNNLNSLVHHVLSRVNISINVDVKDGRPGAVQPVVTAPLTSVAKQ